MTDIRTNGTQAMLGDSRKPALSKYIDLVVGRPGWMSFLKYEMITSLFGMWPGAPGLWLRRVFYKSLFRKCGRNVVIGANVSIRHPHRISVGDNVVIEEGCTLDAKGRDGLGIVLGNGVFLGKGTIVSMAGGTVEIEEGANIGSYCRIGTLAKLRIGRKALLAAYCYVVGGGHETGRTDIPILDQPNTAKGAVEVGDGCWLGARVTVMDGAKIGRDTIVGAHAVVTADLPELSVAVGIPAKVIKSRHA